MYNAFEHNQPILKVHNVFQKVTFPSNSERIMEKSGNSPQKVIGAAQRCVNIVQWPRERHYTGDFPATTLSHLDDILVKYVIDSCVLCVDNNTTKSIEKVLLVKVWLTKNMSSN